VLNSGVGAYYYLRIIVISKICRIRERKFPSPASTRALRSALARSALLRDTLYLRTLSRAGVCSTAQDLGGHNLFRKTLTGRYVFRKKFATGFQKLSDPSLFQMFPLLS